MRLTCNNTKLRSMSKDELIEQTGISTYLLMNEVKAKNNELITAPLLDTDFHDEELELEFNENGLVPNKPTTLRLVV